MYHINWLLSVTNKPASNVELEDRLYEIGAEKISIVYS